MLNVFKIFGSIIKHFGKAMLTAIHCGRYYHGVEFYNSKNIELKNVVIEKGTRLLVIEPVTNKPNIVIEDKCWIGRDVEIQAIYKSSITLKNNVSVQDRCKIIGDVYIGQDSLLAPDVFLSSGNHYFDVKPPLLIKQQDKLVVNDAESFERNSKQITIGEDCWIGKNVIIQSGITIGRGAVIAANSLVRQNIPPYEVWGGLPAKFLKNRLDFVPPNQLNYQIDDHRPYFYIGFDHKNVLNGFVSTNSSACILSKNLTNTSLFLEGEIIESGILKVWFNNHLVLDKEYQAGVLNENVAVSSIAYNDTAQHNLQKQFTDELKKYSLLFFEFLPKNDSIRQGFSIHKITYND
jgi:acetyltransferase-like isoleucine patch superfamily enzyme